MKKARNFWRDLPQGGSRYGSVLTRLFLLLCLLATAQAGWAQTYKSDYSDFEAINGSSDKYKWIPKSVVDASNWIAANSATNGSQQYKIFIDPATGVASTSTTSAYFYRPKDRTNSRHLTFYLTNITSVTFYAYNSSSGKTLKVKVNGGSEQTIATTTNSDKSITGTIDNLDANTKYTIEVYNQNSSSSAAEMYIGAIKVTPGSSGPTAPTFSPVSGTTVSGSQTITINGPSGSTIYYAWATSAQDAAAIYNSGSGSHGTADAGTATTTVESGKTLYAIARKNDTNSTVASASYTIDDAAPTLSSANPANGATGVATSGTIVLTFNEAIASVDATKFSLSSGSKDGVAIDGSDNTKVNITYSGMANNTAITLTTVAGAVTDAVGNTSAALDAITFTTASGSATPAAAPSISFRDSGEDYVTTSNNKDYTITDATHNFKVRVVPASNTYVRYDSGTTEPEAPTLTTGTEISGTESGNITFTGTYYIKAVAWDKDKNPESATEILFTFTPGAAPEPYTITKTSATGGSFTVKVGGSEVTEATAGTMVTITTTPNPGKEVDVITLSPSGSATKASENNYTFTMPTSAVTVTVTFKDATVSGLTPVTSYTWAVDQSAWNSYTTSSEIKANTIVDNIEVIADNKHSVKFGSQKKDFTDGSSYTKFWKLGSPGSEFRLLHFKVAGRCKISAYVYQGSNRTVEIRKGGYNGTIIAETDISSSTPTIVSGDYTDNTEADIYVYSKSNELGVFAIKVEALAAEVAAPEITQTDGDTYTTVAPTKSMTIATKEDEGTTYYVVGTTAATDGAAIYADTNKQTASSSAVSLNLSTYATSESNVIISAVTKKGDNYSDVVTATYTYAGKRSFQVKAADKTLQVGGRDNVDPYITYLDGTLFDVSEDEHDLSYYFTFTYTKTAGSDDDVLVASNGVINIPSTAKKDHTATIEITATPTTEGEAIFKGGAQTGTMTVTVKEKEEGLKMSFYWDPECTEANKVQTSEWDLGDGGSRSVFKNPYENGRMIYVKPDPGYEIWVATVSSKTKNDSGLTTPTASIGKYDNTHYSTTHGIPLYISEMSNGDEGTLVIGLKAYKAGTTEGVGSAVSARFSIKQTEAGQAHRPAAPTFSPTKSEAGTLSTAQTVAAVGATNSYVFSKFGSNTLGLGYFINYLEGTQAGREQVATFSTEVGGRDIKALQITGSGKEYYISEYGKVDGYPYNLAAKLLVTPATYYVNVGDAFTTPALTKITTDQEEEPDASDYSSPTLTGYFYNKQKAEANAAPYQGLKFEEPAGTSLLSYSIQNFNGAGASIDPSTGVVAIGNKSGYAIVTVNYAGGENYTIETKKVGKKNTTTSPMTATYRINIVDPDEYLPIINPTSRKFANSLDVTISVPDENHYVKYVVANNNDGTSVPAPAEVKENGKLINKNSRVTVTVGENIEVGQNVTVFAVAYDDNGGTSKVVKETYKKVTPLQKPTLSPDGVTKPYEYTKDELAVAAVAYNAGAVIYYTTDGSDPTKSGAKTYDGASKILVEKEDGTTIVKAAAYLDGIYSDVVTGTYVPTDNLAKPWFLVNGIKVEDTEKTISTTDVITISNGREEDGSVYYYTLDGTAPTTTEGQVYNTTGFTLVKTVTASAIATENGLISPATTVKFIINDEGKTKHTFWEAIDETTPKGTMDAEDRKVYVTKHTDTEGTSSYIYVENLAATFGGFDNNDWNKTSIGEKSQGAAMDGVGKYSIRNIMDVKEETDRDYDPTNMLIGTVHGRTHALPSQGAYVKFEPEKDGVLTIWALQQGGLHYSADGDFCSRFIRFRPVFMVDETGKSIEATTAESTACLSKNWGEVEPDNWLPRNSGDQNGDKNLYYSDGQNDAIYNMYTTWMTDNSISNGGSIKPFKAPKEIYPTLFTTGSQNADDYADVYGYVMPSGGNVKYTFNVQAGKTYFFFGFRTKLGIRGFNFVPTTTDLETVTLPQTPATAVESFFNTNNNQTKNVKLVRKVKKDTWTTFCLPFSVSQTQLENTFGAGTQVMQFVNVEGYTMNVFKHYHHMIVAGTPILVKPTNVDDNMTEFTFNGVHIENVTPEEICDSEDDTYKFVGGYTPMEIKNGSYYIGNDGLWHKLNNTSGKSTLNGSRAYLKLKEGSNAKTLTLNIASYDGEEDYTTTGIANIESDGIDLDGVNDSTNKFDDNIYNVQGQLVRKHAKNLNGLAKGVYIINGKKVVIND